MIEVNKIFNENCITGLKKIPDASIDCCVTSPPYFGLRDYGNKDQIGLEKTPEMYVTVLLDVFSEVYRVLKPTGTLWLNLGDTYAGYYGDKYGKSQSFSKNRENNGNAPPSKESFDFNSIGFKPKDLIGIPWMVAFALRSAGWYLRQVLSGTNQTRCLNQLRIAAQRAMSIFFY